MRSPHSHNARPSFSVEDDNERALRAGPPASHRGGYGAVGAGQGWLFPDLESDAHGKRTSALSKAFGRYLRALKLDRGGRVVTHSTRHSVADRLRAGRVPEDVRDQLLGHAGGGTGRRYGTAHSVKTLQAAIAAIEYRGVKLPR